MAVRIIFVLGKGGVGKTTLAVTLTAFLRQNAVPALVCSLDQAHNLYDIVKYRNVSFEKIPNYPQTAIEVDLPKYTEKYLNDIKQSVKGFYAYKTAYSIDEIFDLFRYAPDIEQLSMTLAISDLVSSYGDYYLLLDMPPTALSLAFFDAIERNLLWIEKLLQIRKQIKKQRDIITTISSGSQQIETDKILLKLEGLLQFYQKLKQLFHSSLFIVIKNPDEISTLEADRIEKHLLELGYQSIVQLTNKAQKSNPNEFWFADVRNLPISEIIKANYDILVKLKNLILE